MKKFSLIASIICYVFVIISTAITIICTCIEIPPASFYISNSLAIIAMAVSGTTCLLDYLDIRKLEKARK